VLRRWWCLLTCCLATGCLLDPKGEDPSANALLGPGVSPSNAAPITTGPGDVEGMPLPGMEGQSPQPSGSSPGEPVVEVDDMAPGADDAELEPPVESASEQTETEPSYLDSDGGDAQVGDGGADGGAVNVGNPELQAEAGLVPLDAALVESPEGDPAGDAAAEAGR
jgi:hypothetical protein